MAGCDKQVSFCLSPYCQQVQTDLSRERERETHVKMNTKHSFPTVEKKANIVCIYNCVVDCFFVRLFFLFFERVQPKMKILTFLRILGFWGSRLG